MWRGRWGTPVEEKEGPLEGVLITSGQSPQQMLQLYLRREGPEVFSYCPSSVRRLALRAFERRKLLGVRALR